MTAAKSPKLTRYLVEQSQAEALLFFNPAYEHMAKDLSHRLGVVGLAKGVVAVNDKPGGQKGNTNACKNNCANVENGTIVEPEGDCGGGWGSA